MAVWASDAIVKQLSTQSVPIVLALPLDWRVLAFTAAATVVTMLVVGTAPAWRAARLAPIDTLKYARQRGPGRPVPSRWRSASAGLVIAEVALSLVLLIAAGLFVRTLGRLADTPLGFDAERVLVATVDTSRVNVSPAERIAFFQRLAEAVSAVPGVARASVSSNTPLNDPGSVAPEGVVAETIVAPGWFQTYGIPIRSGRDFTAADSATAQPVVMITLCRVAALRDQRARSPQLRRRAVPARARRRAGRARSGSARGPDGSGERASVRIGPA
jgi:hypothetical protein